MLAIELVKDRQTKEPLTEQETKNIAINIILSGLLISFKANVLRLLPPLIIDQEIADTIVNIFDQTLHTGITAQTTRQVRLGQEVIRSKLNMI